MAKLPRRRFVRLLVAGLGALVGAPLLSGCERRPAPAPTATPTPSPTPAARTAIAGKYPEAPSRVVRVRRPGLWLADAPGLAIGSMLDAGIAKLTGLDDPRQAWAALFDPGERIAIKVNAILTGSTHVSLVMAVVERLAQAGIPPEQITIYDQTTDELEGAGFPVNRDGPGVRCFGTDGRFTPGWEVAGDRVQLSHILAGCDAVINMPVLKTATTAGAGISFAMKNHYGCCDRPYRFHGERFAPGVCGLNALPPIRERTRLIIGDLLSPKTKPDSVGYLMIGGEDAIQLSFDPLAHDAVGLQTVTQALSALGLATQPATVPASRWLQAGADLGLGTNSLDHIELVEQTLG